MTDHYGRDRCSAQTRRGPAQRRRGEIGAYL